jgi:hypothetical protein
MQSRGCNVKARGLAVSDVVVIYSVISHAVTVIDCGIADMIMSSMDMTGTVIAGHITS